MANTDLNIEYYRKAKSVFLYDKTTGKLIRRIDRKRYKKGSVLKGTISKTGYLVTQVGLNKKYKFIKMHRLIFFICHGTLPKVIDHIDGNPLNNKIENLRECTQSQNTMNSKLSKNNTSGRVGVRQIKKTGNWVAIIMVNRKKIHIGTFPTFELACRAREKAEIKYFKNFRRKM